MNDFTTALLSILTFMTMGFVARRLGVLDEKVTRTLYKFLFTVPLPIVVLVSLTNAHANIKLLALPVVGSLVAVTLVAISYCVGKVFKFERKMHGALMTAAGITSTLTFALPFVLVFYGERAAQYLFLYDFGGAIVAWTLVYYISGRMGNKKGQTLRQSMASFAKTPMIWALLVGLALSLASVKLPDTVIAISAKLSVFAGVMILMGIGIFFSVDFLKYKKNIARVLLGITITTFVSGVLAYAFTVLFDVSGLARTVVIIAAIAPAGALTVPFCAEHELDVEYASALVALPTIISVVAVFVLLAKS